MQEVDPFDPWGSKLVEVITETDPDKLMPPPPIQSLTPAEIQLIVDWIQQGAPNNSCVGGCDTTNVTYSGTIAPWLQFKCTGCHSGSAPQGGLDLTDRAAANTVALDGRMPGAIQHQSPYVSMPPAGGMLPQCDIDKVLHLDTGRRTEQLIGEGMYRQLIYLFLFIAVAASGCYYDNEEELYPFDFCDVTNVTYSGTIQPIVQGNCAVPGCHVPGATSPDLSTYAGLKTVADNGKLRQQTVSGTHHATLRSAALDATNWPSALRLDAGAPNN